MKLTAIPVVAAFLLYSVVAEKNGPSNILSPRRRFNQPSAERIIDRIRENLNNSRRLPRTAKLMSVPRNPRNPQRKFPPMMTPTNPFTVRSRRSDVTPPGKSSPTKLYHKRRSSELGTASNRISSPEIDEAVIFLEPVYREESTTNLFSYLLGKHFAHDSNDELGPSIGPLKIPGIGNNVYMRLMVPPDQDTTSHVTVHLDNKTPVESISDIYKSAMGSAPSRKPNPLFTGKKSIISMAPILPKPLISSRPMNSRRSRFVLDKPFHHFGFTPSKVEPMGLFRVPNHLKMHQEMANHRPTRFGNPRQYSAAPNHHQLPIVLRPADNMIDLPIYPPLSADGFNYGIESNLSKTNVSTDSQNEADDTQQSASAKHTSFSRDNLNSQTAWQSIRVLFLPRSEVTSNHEESPEPVFIEEIIAPDLSSGNVSTWGKLNVAGGYGSVNLQLENTSSAPDATEDKHVVPATLDYPSRQSTTTYRTDYLFRRDERFGEPEEDNPGGQLRSTTSNPSPTEETRY